MNKYIRSSLIRRIVDINSSPLVPYFSSLDICDIEEILRRTMVSIFPLFLKKRHSLINPDELILNIKYLSLYSSSYDLRYIDALNNLYEVWDKDLFSDMYVLFIGYYLYAINRTLD